MPKIREKKVDGDFITTTIRLHKQNFQHLQNIASQQGVSNSAVLETLLKRYIRSVQNKEVGVNNDSEIAT